MKPPTNQKIICMSNITFGVKGNMEEKAKPTKQIHTGIININHEGSKSSFKRCIPEVNPQYSFL